MSADDAELAVDCAPPMNRLNSLQVGLILPKTPLAGMARMANNPGLITIFSRFCA